MGAVCQTMSLVLTTCWERRKLLRHFIIRTARKKYRIVYIMNLGNTNYICCPVSGQIKAFQCYVFDMLHHLDVTILHAIYRDYIIIVEHTTQRYCGQPNHDLGTLHGRFQGNYLRGEGNLPGYFTYKCMYMQ